MLHRSLYMHFRFTLNFGQPQNWQPWNFGLQPRTRVSILESLVSILIQDNLEADDPGILGSSLAPVYPSLDPWITWGRWEANVGAQHKFRLRSPCSRLFPLSLFVAVISSITNVGVRLSTSVGDFWQSYEQSSWSGQPRTQEDASTTGSSGYNYLKDLGLRTHNLHRG